MRTTTGLLLFVQPLLILTTVGCSTQPLEPPDAASQHAGLTCTVGATPAATAPVEADGKRVNYYEPVSQKTCQVTVEVDPIKLRTDAEYSCYPQQLITLDATPLLPILEGPLEEKLSLPICGALNLGDNPEDFVRSGPRPAIAEIFSSRAYQYGADDDCIIGFYENISVTLRDVTNTFADGQTALPFGGYTYREIERRPAADCDAIIDSFRP
jgi:hypothetical protein